MKLPSHPLACVPQPPFTLKINFSSSLGFYGVLRLRRGSHPSCCSLARRDVDAMEDAAPPLLYSVPPTPWRTPLHLRSSLKALHPCSSLKWNSHSKGGTEEQSTWQGHGIGCRQILRMWMLHTIVKTWGREVRRQGGAAASDCEGSRSFRQRGLDWGRWRRPIAATSEAGGNRDVHRMKRRPTTCPNPAPEGAGARKRAENEGAGRTGYGREQGGDIDRGGGGHPVGPAEDQSPLCGRQHNSPLCGWCRWAGAPWIGSSGVAAMQVDGNTLGSTVAADGALGLFHPRASGGGRSKGVISRRFKILRFFFAKITMNYAVDNFSRTEGV